VLEGTALLPRLWRAFGRLGERGPPDGPKLMVLPGFLATDRTTLGLQRALAASGYRVTGWGLGLNRGVRPDTLARIAGRLEAFAGGEPVILVGWSLGGIYAREVAKVRPELVARVVTLGTPFSGDRRNNNVWRLYEMIAGHPVDRPPVGGDPAVKPPVPTLALWSRRDGLIAPAAARGEPGERDREHELDCRHMGYAVSGRAFRRIIQAIRAFNSCPAFAGEGDRAKRGGGVHRSP
jgi:pimeloyl-ACP methyl ester carboxylesterase